MYIFEFFFFCSFFYFIGISNLCIFLVHGAKFIWTGCNLYIWIKKFFALVWRWLLNNGGCGDSVSAEMVKIVVQNLHLDIARCQIDLLVYAGTVYLSCILFEVEPQKWHIWPQPMAFNLDVLVYLPSHSNEILVDIA